jgi:hypothetical protein
MHCRHTVVCLGLWASLVVVPLAGEARDAASAKKSLARPSKLARIASVDCGTAVELGCRSAHDSSNVGLASTVDSYRCADFAETGGEVVYRFTLAAVAQVSIRLHGLSADLDLFLLSGCDPDACIAASTGVSEETIVRCLDAGTYFLVVDGFDGGASEFQLELECGPCGPCGPDAAADACATARSVPGHLSPYVITGDTRCAHDDYHDSGCTGYSSLGRDLAYRLVMPPGCRVQANLRDGPDGVSLDHALYLIESCAGPAGTCVAGADASVEGDESITFESAAGGIYYLIVDAFGLDASGDFILEINQTNCSVVAVEARAWQDVKRLYR